MIEGVQRRASMRSSALVILLTLTGFAIAQTDPGHQRTASVPRFEVVSINPSAPGTVVIYRRYVPGGVIYQDNVTLEELIVNTWHVQPHQISGGPAWIRTARYDISAKPEKPPKPGEVLLMLQALLADRFSLAVHRETKDLPIYALVIASKDGKLGPSLLESKEGGCTASNPSGPPSLPDPERPSTRWCGLLMMRPRQLNGAAVPIVALAEQLSMRLGRTVVNTTGLNGKYDVDLQWTSDEGAIPNLYGSPGSIPPSDPQGQTILTALKDQVGLKLESRRGPVEVIVIDHVERPSGN